MVKTDENKVLTCFKAYDIRGRLGDELNEAIAYRIGRAYAVYLKPESVVLGADMRHSSEALKMALANGLMDEDVDVIDIGMAGTEEMYFATFQLKVDGGIEVTASHNPMDYNGMKLVRNGSRPISGDTGLHEIQKIAETNQFAAISKRGTYIQQDTLPTFVNHLMTYIDRQKLRPLKLVVNAGNGAAGHVIDAIEQVFKQKQIPINFIKVHHQADGSIPNGIPNPLLPENRAATSDAVIAHQADMGIAWDGDFDRCFLFDEHGAFIEGYYIVGLLAAAFLAKHPNEKIIHDPRLTWNTQDIVVKSGGQAIMSKTGHAFIKERMRAENAIYGGEMSAHHYFRDFAYCDSGMIPWLLVCELLSQTNQPLSKLVAERIELFPCSGEINFKVENVASAIHKIETHFMPESTGIDDTDGLSMTFANWRFNLRGSNTEPLLRLNVESRANKALVQQKVDEISDLIQSL
ncbi:MAG: phosphomannomutase CpsG [Betaproteobacteria bacterium HGW-Betaproteobacteria-20]|nr:MAG: phosphomannomutase CpsG [Betaproteobacteria bacterium HGW-Betaproteobacteria-20]